MSTPTITLTPPASNTAAEWNAQIKEAAEKAGLPIPVPGATVVAADPADKKEDDKTIYRTTLTLGGKEMVLEDTDPAGLVKQVSAAVEAAQLAPAPAAAVVTPPEKKPAFTEAELFDISLKIQKGDVSALDTYFEKSGVIDRVLEAKGLKVDDLKAATQRTQTNDLNERWKEATDQFTEKVKKGESDYPGGAQNTYLMGIMLAELGLREKPSVDSFERAYAELKKRNMVFPVEKKTTENATTTATTTTTTPPEKKTAASSTAIGTTGGQEVRQAAPTGKVELDITKLTPREYSESYNQLLRLGYKPEQIVIKQ